jgi:acetylornithine aminotransferase
LAKKLGEMSGLPSYSLFLVNSGAEANENAIKLASFKTRRKKCVVLQNSFHGRTGGLVAMTGNSKIIAPINQNEHLQWVAINDNRDLENALTADTAALIIEGIQGIGGIYVPDREYLEYAATICRERGIVLILDEIQSGYGRSGHFFAYQRADIKPDLITVAKGMGNGFPIGGVLISPAFEASAGLLGTTFGGNPLACAAGLSVLKCIEEERLIDNASIQGNYLIKELIGMDGVTEVRGEGLMIGVSFEIPALAIRKSMFEEKVLTGSASDTHTMRLLPPLCIGIRECDIFLEKFSKVMKAL